MAGQGKIFVLEGLDGSGKATQAQLLTKALRDRGMPVRQVSFPNYESDSSALVRMYLSGQFGSAPSDVNAYAASSFYAVDRYAGYKMNWGGFYDEGGIIVADRYTTSNAIHQCSKLSEDEWDEYLQWLFHYEYALLGIPEPHQVIYLRVAPEVSQRLMHERYHGDDQKRDIHEADLQYLNRSRSAADYCAQKLQWHVIECCAGGEMRTIEDIHSEILSTLNGISLKTG